MEGDTFVTFQEARDTDETVHKLMEIRAGPEAIIIALVEQKRVLTTELVTLIKIAPKRYRLKDGKQVVWHCPNELIPETQL